jgi:hypothetical protein
VKSATSVSRRNSRGRERLAAIVGDDVVHGFVPYTGTIGIQLAVDPRLSAVPVSAQWSVEA